MKKIYMENRKPKRNCKNKKREKDLLYRVCVMLICLFPRIVLCLQSYPLRTRHDELATISAAAYFAGLDWGEVVSNASYYGTGFTAFLSVIFKMTDNPIFIYRSLLCVCSILQASCGLICFSILKNTFHIRNKLYLVISSVMSSFMVVTRANIVYNEHMLIFLMWLSLYCLIYINASENRGKRRFGSVLLAVLLSYSYTVHTRAIVFTIAIVLMILFLFVYKGMYLVDIKYFVLTEILGMFIAKKYIDWMQKVLWRVEEGEVLANSQISIINKIGMLSEWNAWKAIFCTIIGQLNTISMVSAGLLIVMLGSAAIFIYRGMGRRVKKDKNLNIIYIIFLYSALCIGITIAGQSLTWISQTKSVIDYGYGSNLYGTKGFTYIRYFGPYCAPLIMLFSMFLYKYYKETRRIVIIMFPIQILLQICWIFLIVPYMEGTTQTGGIEALICFVRENLEGKFDFNFFYAVSMVSISIYFLMVFLVRSNRKTLLISCVSFFLIYQYIYNAKIWDIQTQYGNYCMVDDVYETIELLKEEGIDVPKQIYVIPEERDSVHYLYYEYQMVLNRHSIIPGYPNNQERRAIICSRNRLLEISLDKVMEIQLDQYEYMYFVGNSFIRQVKDVLENRNYIIK